MSHDQLMTLPLPQFIELQLFDEYIEPSSAVVQDIHFAMLQDAVYRSSGNMSKQGLKKMKVKDFRIISDERIFQTEEELAEASKKKEQKKINDIVSMIPAAEMEKLQKAMTKKKGVANGKG